MSDITNPAAGASALKRNGNPFRFGVLSSVGVGAEFGQVDDLYNSAPIPMVTSPSATVRRMRAMPA